jgi:hypothetical protein
MNIVERTAELSESRDCDKLAFADLGGFLSLHWQQPAAVNPWISRGDWPEARLETTDGIE